MLRKAVQPSGFHNTTMHSPRALPRSIAAALLLTSTAVGAQRPAAGSSQRPRVIQPAPAQQAPAVLTQLKVVTLVIPAGDPGRFTLSMDGAIPGGLFGGAANLGNNGTTGFVPVSAGSHVVTRTGALGTNANDYTASFSASCPGGNVTLAAGASEICTITNVRRHGSWMGGPGTHLVTVCAPFPSAQGANAGRGGPCTIYGNPGQIIPIVAEVWGAGGGGGAGQQQGGGDAGSGGGGGGAGGYGKTTLTATVPASGATIFHVTVGAGGVGGVAGIVIGGVHPQVFSAAGGFSEVRLGNATGTVAVKAMGGARGAAGWLGNAGGAGGGTIAGGSNAAGLSGGNGGVVTGCNGGGGGLGGAGSGPGATNGGGNGGHGGYYKGFQVIDGPVQQPRVCSAASQDNGLTSGVAGKEGAVKLAW
ncbi:hypothetical protein BH11GEM1_BH11GEM1_32880 [soil metagenome]